MKKKSITAIKKDIHSMIREVVIQFKPLDTERIKVNTPNLVADFIS